MDGTLDLDDLLVEFVAAVASQAIRGADRVAALLREAGIAPALGDHAAAPVGLPAELLLGLDLVLRFATWEQNLIFVHIESGLPSSDELLQRILELLPGEQMQSLISDLSGRSMVLLAQHFTWRAGVEQQIDLAIVDDDDEALLDAVADFHIRQKRQTSLVGNNS
jgi:hypothetical protein